MGESDIAVFGVWSSITIIVIVITGLVYRVYRRKKNEASSS
jgi:heme/copper-type cytochrome/quinol oxidase subunit 2